MWISLCIYNKMCWRTMVSSLSNLPDSNYFFVSSFILWKSRLYRLIGSQPFDFGKRVGRTRYYFYNWKMVGPEIYQDFYAVPFTLHGRNKDVHGNLLPQRTLTVVYISYQLNQFIGAFHLCNWHLSVFWPVAD